MDALHASPTPAPDVGGRTRPPGRARPGLFALCALTLVAACGNGVATSAGGQKLVGGPADSACEPSVHVEGCTIKLGGVQTRMRCDKTTATWQEIAECAPQQLCYQNPDPANPQGFGLVTECKGLPVYDAGSLDGAAAGADATQPPDSGPGQDSGPQPDAGGPADDAGAVVLPTQEVDPKCLDGQYKEALPVADAGLSGPFAAYEKAKAVDFIHAVLQARYPWGSALVSGAVKAAPQNCVDLFLPESMRGSAKQVMDRLEVVVHECGHMYDMYPMSFADTKYAIQPQLTLKCAGLRSSSSDTGSGSAKPSFPRSAIKQDAFGKKRPPCEDGKGSHGCDSYAKVYLDGDPNDGTFQSGDQGFNMLVEEVNQYVNSLATRYAFADQSAMSTSARDGILTFLWYMQRYLHMARTLHPQVYADLKADACWRQLVLTLWGRAWLFLEATQGMPKLGIEHAKIIELVRDPELLAEIARIRTAHGCK